VPWLSASLAVSLPCCQGTTPPEWSRQVLVRYDAQDWPNLHASADNPEDAMAVHIGGSARWVVM
jgi:hypothetical protein